MVENQSGTKLKALRTDNGGEYVSSEFKDFCSKRGIRRQFTTPYTPSQNDIAERLNWTIQERVTAMLSLANLPPEFWGEAVMTAVHIINRSPSTPLNNKIPQEKWTGKKPNYDRLCVFGSEAFSHVAKELRKKLDPKTHKSIFIGYERPESSSQAVRRSMRISCAPKRFQPRLDYLLVTDCGEPTCYKEAIQMEDCAKWEQAMQSEYNSIVANETWELTKLPEGKQALPCKRVYKKKYTADDPEPKYKARLVAKGFK
ncbi:hypothetical protein L7F22_048327 [Adiantum nelumboides]|nr:hypothetical protein [Adiantum nelumboides]